MAIATKTLISYLEKYLDVSRIKDYCPNGLQVEGKDIQGHDGGSPLEAVNRDRASILGDPVVCQRDGRGRARRHCPCSGRRVGE